MPNGEVHGVLHKLFWPLPVFVSGWLYFQIDTSVVLEVVSLIAILIGYYLGNYIDPDLDMIGSTRAEKLWRKVFWPMSIWWKLYAVLVRSVGGHRSFLTHMPFISTAIRLLWILILPISLFHFTVGFSETSWDVLWSVLYGVFIGLSLSDTVHVLADAFL